MAVTATITGDDRMYPIVSITITLLDRNTITRQQAIDLAIIPFLPHVIG